jgi:hypothetical protein
LYGLGVRGVGVLLFLVAFFCQVWLQHPSKIFDLWSSCFLPLVTILDPPISDSGCSKVRMSEVATTHIVFKIN